MKYSLVIYTLLLFVGISAQELSATSFVTEAYFESYEDHDLAVQESIFQKSLKAEHFLVQENQLEARFDYALLNEESTLTTFDFRFDDDLRSIAFVRSSIFGILSNFSFQTNFTRWEPLQSSWLKRFLFFDVLPPEEDKKLISKLLIFKSKLNQVAFQATYQNISPSFLLRAVTDFSRLSFSKSINRKLMRYYAIRSDGPPHHSFKQVFV
ncbi:hypothetical protein [Leptospira kmetyi]|uniref:hypothetical protein n=1 Tax=Leptospira kmetyi TaxID=408139 RepID=UPI003EBA6EB9